MNITNQQEVRIMAIKAKAYVEECQDDLLVELGYSFTVVVVAEEDESDVLDLIDCKDELSADSRAEDINQLGYF